MNPLYQQMMPQNNIMQRFQQFRQQFQGNPQQQIQEMLNSGRITQEQYNQAVQTATQLRNMFGV